MGKGGNLQEAVFGGEKAYENSILRENSRRAGLWQLVLIFEAVDGRRDAAAELDKGFRIAFGHSHNGGFAQQAAEGDFLPHPFAGHWDKTCRRGFVVDNADGHFIGNEGGNGRGGGVAGDGDHIQPYGADAGHGFQFFYIEIARAGGSLDAGIFGNGDEGAGEAADGGGGEGAAFFDGVIEHGQNGRAARSADTGEPEALENLADGIADGGGGSEGEVGYTKGDA